MKIKNIKERYKWEIELKDGTIIKEGKKYNFKFDDVVRCSYIPTFALFPRHDIIFTDFKFKKRFARGFMGWNSIIREFLHCVITDKFRFYLKSSNGSVIITEKDYEMRI